MRAIHLRASQAAVLIISITACWLWIACERRQTAAQASDPAQPAAVVQYVEAKEQPVAEAVELVAKVQPDPTKVIHIYPPASGRVLAILVKPGDHVRRGETVAIIQSSDIATARTDYAKSQIEAQRAARALDREKSLYEHGAAAEKDYVDAKAAADAARAEVERARQRLEVLNVDASGTSDRVSMAAPRDGSVLDVNAAPGEFSKSLDNASPLITFADLNTVWIVGDVYEKDLAKLSLGKPVSVTVTAYPGLRLAGKIDSIGDAIDPNTRTLKVRVVLPNPDRRLKPEMFATIHVDAGTHPGVLVPASAVIHEGNTASVFVESSGKPERRNVTVGATANGQVEVISGLRPGETVAAEGAELLRNGGPGV
jgi:cobalt-zinc-cadmium efflux system membrane fusion protein